MNMSTKICCVTARSVKSGTLTSQLYFGGTNDFLPFIATFTFPIWVKFHMRYLNEILFSSCEFCESWRRGLFATLKVVKEIAFEWVS